MPRHISPNAAGGGNLCVQLIRREIEGPNQSNSSIIRERFRLINNLCHRNLVGHFSCVNAIEFSYGGKYLASGGDDTRVRVWDMGKSTTNIRSEPITMSGQHSSNIFCVSFDRQTQKVYSGGNDELVITHDFETRNVIHQKMQEGPVYGLATDFTSNNVIAIATEFGNLKISDTRSRAAKDMIVTAAHSTFSAVQFHPMNGNFLASANSRTGAALWDLRNLTRPYLQYHYATDLSSCMSVCFNKTGTKLLTLHRRLPPILYDTNLREPKCTFYDEGYFNSCTMKSCCFAGPEDELILSGSDNFNLYVWRLNNAAVQKNWVESADMVLYGHRSIVNQVRYNREHCIIASSGVEKIIKLWSPFQRKGWTGELIANKSVTPKMRPFYTVSTDGFNAEDIEEEDTHMMAFFDSLVRQELQSMTESDESDDSYEADSGLAQDVDDAANNAVPPQQQLQQEQAQNAEEQPNIISTLLRKRKSILRQLAFNNYTAVNSPNSEIDSNTESDDQSDSLYSLTCISDLRADDFANSYSDDQPSTSAFAAEYGSRMRRALLSFNRSDSSSFTDTDTYSTDSSTSDTAQRTDNKTARKRKSKFMRSERRRKRHRYNLSTDSSSDFSRDDEGDDDHGGEDGDGEGDVINVNEINYDRVQSATRRDFYSDLQDSDDEDDNNVQVNFLDSSNHQNNNSASDGNIASSSRPNLADCKLEKRYNGNHQ